MCNTVTRAFLAAIALPLSVIGSYAQDGLELSDLTRGDPFFYTRDQVVKESDAVKALVGTGRPDRTHSQVPHLPVYFGYMNTNYTYRFITVAEQVMTMIGEGKHGLWRLEENGTIREYLRNGAAGLKPGSDIFAEGNLAVIADNYSNYLPDEGFDGYKYPDQRVNSNGELNYVDLPVSHPKYKGKYARHEPIDLPNFYCTMSESDYPYARQALSFAFAQPGANKIGPLGRRAGLDVRENYTNVIRLDHFPDARAWVNVGQEGADGLHVKWEAVDATRTRAEYYLVERPFFNKPYIFIMAVFDNEDNDDFRYVRPAGPYFDHLRDRGAAAKTSLTAAPAFHLENGQSGRPVGLPIYGVHHPNRAAFGGGGACPLKGGDWGRYPDPSGGAGWPTQYEEVTPLCDAVLVDIKFYSNLDGRDWNDSHKYLANAGAGSRTVTYKVQPGEYGAFTDPYNTSRGVKNSESQYVPSEVTLTYPTAEAPVAYTPVPQPAFQKAEFPAASTSCRPIRMAQ